MIVRRNILFVVNVPFYFSTSFQRTNDKFAILSIKLSRKVFFRFRSLLFYSQSLPWMPFVLSRGHLDLVLEKKKKSIFPCFFMWRRSWHISKLCWVYHKIDCVINCLSHSAPLVWCTSFDRNDVPNQSSTVIFGSDISLTCAFFFFFSSST